MRNATVCWVLVATVLAASPAWADFQDGQRASQRGDYAAAYREWLPLAEQGQAQAQAALGFLYLNGQGVTKDDAEALKWLRRAAEQGNAWGQNNLGAMFWSGRGVRHDDGEAVKWFQRAADQGWPMAQFNLGNAYSSGRGAPKDAALAYTWYSLAIKKGLPGEVLERALKGREKVAEELSPEQMASAAKMAQDWKPRAGARADTPTLPHAQGAAPSPLRLWGHIYGTPGAPSMTIAKPWIKGPLYSSAEGCLAAALKQANLTSSKPPAQAGWFYRQRVLQDGVVVVTYVPPDGFPVLITYIVCKADEWQAPLSSDEQADKREAFQGAVFSFGPAPNNSTIRPIFVESTLLDKHPMKLPELKWCGADRECNARLSVATNLLRQATATMGGIISYTPGRAIIVGVMLNGRVTARLLLDTGADGTVVKPSLLAAAGVDLSRPATRGNVVGVAGSTRVSYFPVDLEVAGHRVPVPEVAALNSIDDGADGLLGRDFLDRFKIIVDPAAGTVTLTPK